MNFVDIDDFLDDVMPYVPGCTEFMALDKVRQAAIEFCRMTNVSRETFDDLDLDANEPEVVVPSPSSHLRTYKFLWVRTTQRTLTEANRRMLANRSSDWTQAGTADWPTAFVRIDNETIYLIPTPSEDKAGVLSAQVSFIPTKAASKLDAVLMDEYREAIADGALTRLLSLRNESWYDPNGASDHGLSFASAISNAKAAVYKDQMLADTKVQFLKFA